MVNLRKTILIGAALLFVASLFISCHAMAQQVQPQPCDFKTASGRVVAIDWVGSTLIVDIGGDEISLVVSRDTTFKKGIYQISFSEINQSDNVTVKYYDCGFAGLKATSVTVSSGGY